MGKQMVQQRERKGSLGAVLLVMYIISGLLLVLLSFVVAKVEKEDLTAQIGVILIYVISCGMGGFIIGKWKKQKKFLWGLLAGVLYVLLLAVLGMAIQKGQFPDPVGLLIVAVICGGSGTLGGMIS